MIVFYINIFQPNFFLSIFQLRNLVFYILSLYQFFMQVFSLVTLFSYINFSQPKFTLSCPAS